MPAFKKFNKDKRPKRNTQSLLFKRKRFCRFTVAGVEEIDYKDVDTLRDLLAAHNDALRARGLSPASLSSGDPLLDAVPANGQRHEIPGRMNLSAGGTLVLADAPSEQAVALARQAARAIGLRVAAIDMFVDINGKPGANEIIEVNANPSIRLLEDSGRGNLILKIWRHTFTAMGML